MPEWMWFPGDFEIYHALQLNCRREERGFGGPAYWKTDDCWKNVRFRKRAVLEAPETLIAHTNGIGHVVVDKVQHPFGEIISPLSGRA